MTDDEFKTTESKASSNTSVYQKILLLLIVVFLVIKFSGVNILSFNSNVSQNETGSQVEYIVVVVKMNDKPVLGAAIKKRDVIYYTDKNGRAVIGRSNSSVSIVIDNGINTQLFYTKDVVVSPGVNTIVVDKIASLQPINVQFVMPPLSFSNNTYELLPNTDYSLVFTTSSGDGILRCLEISLSNPYIFDYIYMYPIATTLSDVKEINIKRDVFKRDQFKGIIIWNVDLLVADSIGQSSIIISDCTKWPAKIQFKVYTGEEL
jgi:hypothetical protein